MKPRIQSQTSRSLVKTPCNPRASPTSLKIEAKKTNLLFPLEHSGLRQDHSTAMLRHDAVMAFRAAGYFLSLEESVIFDNTHIMLPRSPRLRRGQRSSLTHQLLLFMAKPAQGLVKINEEKLQKMFHPFRVSAERRWGAKGQPDAAAEPSAPSLAQLAPIPAPQPGRCLLECLAQRSVTARR